jgi:hypothetical protein
LAGSITSASDSIALKLLDAALDEALLFARGVVFGVLGQVAMLARLGDGADDGRTVHRLQLLQFGIQRVKAARVIGIFSIGLPLQKKKPRAGLRPMTSFLLRN